MKIGGQNLVAVTRTACGVAKFVGICISKWDEWDSFASHSAMKNWKKFEIENFMNYLEHAALEVALDKRHSADFIS